MSQGSGVLGSGVLGVRCPNHLQGSHVRGPVSGGPASGGQVRSSPGHTAEKLLKSAKKYARAHNGSFCDLWGKLKVQCPKKQKSTENIERY